MEGIATHHTQISILNSTCESADASCWKTGVLYEYTDLTTSHLTPMIQGERFGVFSGGFAEMGFLLFIAFLLFGPKKLPEIARTLGKGLAELRRASNELKTSLEEEIRNLDRQPEGHREQLAEPAPEYGHEYSEPAPEEPEPRP